MATGCLPMREAVTTDSNPDGGSAGGRSRNAIAAVIEDPGNVPCGEWLSSSPWSALRG